jgi:hypothetical protein
MASSVYVETTIVSYLTARPGRDLVQRAHQQLTPRSWRTGRLQLDLYLSPPDAPAMGSRFDGHRVVSKEEWAALQTRLPFPLPAFEAQSVDQADSAGVVPDGPGAEVLDSAARFFEKGRP